MEEKKSGAASAVLWMRLAPLLSVKSIVTIALTAVFAYMACTETVSRDFMTIYAVIIAFYFGTQSRKQEEAGHAEQS